MMVLLLERTSLALRGELTRWLLEVRAGVFVGRVSAQVRDLLWERVCGQRGHRAAMLIYQTNTEQGFVIRTVGETSRQVVDFDGLQLVRLVQRSSKAHRSERE